MFHLQKQILSKWLHAERIMNKRLIKTFLIPHITQVAHNNETEIDLFILEVKIIENYTSLHTTIHVLNIGWLRTPLFPQIFVMPG